jgi:hypothetical protein
MDKPAASRICGSFSRRACARKPRAKILTLTLLPSLPFPTFFVMIWTRSRPSTGAAAAVVPRTGKTSITARFGLDAFGSNQVTTS